MHFFSFYGCKENHYCQRTVVSPNTVRQRCLVEVGGRLKYPSVKYKNHSKQVYSVEEKGTQTHKRPRFIHLLSLVLSFFLQYMMHLHNPNEPPWIPIQCLILIRTTEYTFWRLPQLPRGALWSVRNVVSVTNVKHLLFTSTLRWRPICTCTLCQNMQSLTQTWYTLTILYSGFRWDKLLYIGLWVHSVMFLTKMKVNTQKPPEQYKCWWQVMENQNDARQFVNMHMQLFSLIRYQIICNKKDKSHQGYTHLHVTTLYEQNKPTSWRSKVQRFTASETLFSEQVCVGVSLFGISLKFFPKKLKK